MLDKLEKQDKRELMYISLVLLIAGDKAIDKSYMKSSIVPEIIQILDPDTLLGLIKAFPGQWIKIPTIEEMEKAAKVIYYYYYTEIEEMSSVDAVKLVKGTKADIRILPRRSSDLKKFFQKNSFKIPDNLCKTDFLKKINECLCMGK